MIGGGSTAGVDAVMWAVAGGAHVIWMSLGIDFIAYVEQLVNEGETRAAATS